MDFFRQALSYYKTISVSWKDEFLLNHMPVSPERLLCIYIIKTNYVIMSEIASKNQQQQESAVIKTGTSAPDFTLHSKPGESVSFNQFRGRPTILAFYPD